MLVVWHAGKKIAAQPQPTVTAATSTTVAGTEEGKATKGVWSGVKEGDKCTFCLTTGSATSETT